MSSSDIFRDAEIELLKTELDAIRLSRDDWHRVADSRSEEINRLMNEVASLKKLLRGARIYVEHAQNDVRNQTKQLGEFNGAITSSQDFIRILLVEATKEIDSLLRRIDTILENERSENAPRT